MSKKCYKCNKIKDFNFFAKNKRYKDGFNDVCKPCRKKINIERKEKDKQYYHNNRDKIISQNKQNYINNKKERLEYSSLYYENNKEELKEYNKKWKRSNHGKVKKYKENFKIRHPRYHNQYQKQKYQEIEHKIKSNIRSRIYNALRDEPKNSSTIELLGCSIISYKQYIESMFVEGMSWDNHGDVWEIDHIKPCTLFDLTKEPDQLECFNYINTRPLFKTTEIAKCLGYDNVQGNRNRKKNT